MVKTVSIASSELEAVSKKASRAQPVRTQQFVAAKVEQDTKMQTKVTMKTKLTVQQRVNAIGRQIQRDYGVMVVPKRSKVANPYDMTADEAAKIMQKAGILTKAGNLSPSYK
jgi:hypothetical protein